ncbi:Ldh family oxidoreductase [Alphaproteobacteria bacterium KMM 3653]|uniref:Ldh family oxidoreductase n=1 Tax=Harenicola maris TaxID=2841044 RepID=A0AAP2CQD9_9RHOB|nr:Ldh family oxidoreductase [Harenicola maris]
MPDIALSDIRSVSQLALTRHGAQEWIAAEMAKAVAFAEGRGNRICGLYYLESYCQQLRSGRVSGTAAPQVSRPKPGFVRVDAQAGFAQCAFLRAMPQALEAARTNGTAALAIHNAHTCTALGYFTEKAARAGMLAIGFTNASPIVAPPGGKARVIGTNPMAFAVPDGAGGTAMGFDFSTSAVALGRITMAKAAGEPIPQGWAVDADGNPATDPEAALGGALVSAGGHKGWGLGLMVELLAAGMTGGLNSLDVKPLKAPEGAPHQLGQFFLLIDPAMSPDFAERLARVAEAVAADPGARLPGAPRPAPQVVDVPDALWQATLTLAG